jgi:hypothetical protein
MNKAILATLVGMSVGVLAACDEPSPQATQPLDAQAQFDAADKNGDGVLTELEGLDVSGLNFSTMDVDKSKSVTRQEFATAMALSRQRG